MRLFSLVAGWLVVVVATTAITWQIVGAADAQVSQQPASPLNVAAPEFNTSSTSRDSLVTSTTTTNVSSSTTAPARPSTTEEPSMSTTTTVPASASSTSAPNTTVPAPTSTTTEQPWSLTSHTSAGGVVVFAHRPGEVRLQAATPAPGFQTTVEEDGPSKVEVEFESESLKVEVSAEWHDGSLDIDESVEPAESDD